MLFVLWVLLDANLLPIYSKAIESSNDILGMQNAF